MARAWERQTITSEYNSYFYSNIFVRQAKMAPAGRNKTANLYVICKENKRICRQKMLHVSSY